MSSKQNAVLPAGVQIHSSLRLLTWHARGVLDVHMAKRIHSFIECHEATTDEPFRRFTDLSELDAVHLSFIEVEDLARTRLETYQGWPVKSAILALNPLAFGMARMYEQLMRPTPIEVAVFCRLTSAAEWLNAPVEVLASER